MGSILGAPSSDHITSTLNCELNLEPRIEGYQYHNVNFLYINSHFQETFWHSTLFDFLNS